MTRPELLQIFRSSASEIAEKDLSKVDENGVIAELGIDSLELLEVIGGLERDAQLSEAVIRCMVVRADHVTEAAMKEALAGPARLDVPPREGMRRDGVSPDAVGREEVVSAIADLDVPDAKE